MKRAGAVKGPVRTPGDKDKVKKESGYRHAPHLKASAPGSIGLARRSKSIIKTF